MAFEHVVKSLPTSGTKTLRSPFDNFVTGIIEYHDSPVHSIMEMKEKRKTKTKGDIFEDFCKRYLLSKGWKEVYLLKEIPEELLEKLGLTRYDVGIDIIARKSSMWSAVQCKFKAPRSGTVPGTWIPYNCVSWKELSTFYGLCARTSCKAKWKYHIVMTNTKYVRRMGEKNEKDWSICYGTFNKLSYMDFIELSSSTDKVIEEVASKLTIDDMRAARLAKFG